MWYFSNFHPKGTIIILKFHFYPTRTIFTYLCAFYQILQYENGKKLKHTMQEERKQNVLSATFYKHLQFEQQLYRQFTYLLFT